MINKLYAFVMRGELTKVALDKVGNINRITSSRSLINQYIDSLSIDLID